MDLSKIPTAQLKKMLKAVEWQVKLLSKQDDNPLNRYLLENSKRLVKEVKDALNKKKA